MNMKKLSSAVLVSASIAIAGVGSLAPSAVAIELSPAPAVASPLVQLPAVQFSGENYEVNIDSTIFSDPVAATNYVPNYPATNLEVVLHTPEGAQSGDTRTIAIPSGSLSIASSPQWGELVDSGLSGNLLDESGNVAATIKWDFVKDSATGERNAVATITYTDWVNERSHSDLFLKIPYSPIQNYDVFDTESYHYNTYNDLSFSIDGDLHSTPFFESGVESAQNSGPEDFGEIINYYTPVLLALNELSPLILPQDQGSTMNVTHKVSSENNMIQFSPDATMSFDQVLVNDANGDNTGSYRLEESQRATGTNVSSSVTLPDTLNASFVLPRAEASWFTGGQNSYVVSLTAQSSTYDSGLFNTSSTPYTWNDNVYTVDTVYEWNGNTSTNSQKFVGNAITARAYGTLNPVATSDSTTTSFGTPITVNLIDNDTSSSGIKSVHLLDANGQRVDTYTVENEGTWSLNTDGSATFTPLTTFSGETTPVNYMITDASGAPSDSAAISAVVSDASSPTVSADTVTTKTNKDVVIDVLANDELTQSGSSWNKVELIDPATGGRVTTLTTPAGTFTVNADNTVTFSPNDQFVGEAPLVNYVATDSNGKEGNAQISLNVEDYSAPASTIDTAEGKENSVISVSVLSNDQLTEDGATWDDVSLVNPTTGEAVKTFTIDGVGVFTVNSDNIVEFDPADGFTGQTPAVSYVATDSNGKSSQSSLTFSVVALSNPIAVDDLITIDRGETVTINPLNNDQLIEDGATWDEVFLVDPVTKSQVKTVTTSAGVYTVNNDNTVTFVSYADFIGSAPVVDYIAVDSYGNIAQSSLDITVNTPVVVPTPEPTPDATPTPDPIPDTTPTPEPAPTVDPTPNPTPSTVTPTPSGSSSTSTPQETQGGTTVTTGSAATDTPVRSSEDQVLINTGETGDNNSNLLPFSLLGLGGTMLSALLWRGRKKN